MKRASNIAAPSEGIAADIETGHASAATLVREPLQSSDGDGHRNTGSGNDLSDLLAEAIGRPLSERGLEAVHAALHRQTSAVSALVESGETDETTLLRGLARALEIEFQAPDHVIKEDSLADRLPPRVALRHLVLPLAMQGDRLKVGISDPFDFQARHATAAAALEPIVWVLTPRRIIIDRIRDLYGIGADTFEEVLAGREGEEAFFDIKQETNVLDGDDPDASVVKFVNQILREALEQRATDIHVEPLSEDLRIRYRIDGVLHEVPVPPKIRMLQSTVLSRLKIMANLDVAERRLPQDGRISLEHRGKPIDVRVATIPLVTGESISLRLLGQERFDFPRLGLASDLEEKFKRLLSLPNGIVLLTGPTGCGKSTTLYTFLSDLNKSERRIVTIEDPVENKLPGVAQIAVKHEIGLTFAAGLRSILRADPNVVMVGEMRDLETAEIAIRAALTGHLVFSTLHTNDAIGGITRLVDMGLEPFLVTAAVRAFIAQRLVRRLCPECCEPADLTPADLKHIGFPVDKAGTIMQAKGCPECRQSGYHGRLAIYEVCELTQRLHDAILARKEPSILREIAARDGMRSLRQYGWQKVAEGVTTIDEVLRVTAEEDAE